MPITTYTELKAAVADWLNRTDLTSVIPDFIALGEAKINRKLRMRDQLSVAVSTVSGEYQALPSDWQRTENLILTTDPNTELIYVSPEQANHEGAQSSSTGKPRYYTVIGRRIRFVPAPDTSYTLRMEYIQGVPALTTGAPTNWLLTANADVYLAAALVYANKYLRDSEGMALALADLDSAMEDMRLADEAAKTPTTPRARTRPIG